MRSLLQSLVPCFLLALAASCTTTQAAHVKIPLEARYPIPGETVGLIGIKAAGGASTQRAASKLENTIQQSLINSGKKVQALDPSLQSRVVAELEKGVVSPELLSEVRLEVGNQEQVEYFIIGSVTSFDYVENLTEGALTATQTTDIWGNPQTVMVQYYSGNASCSIEGSIQVLRVEDNSILYNYDLDVEPWSERVDNAPRPAWNENDIRQVMIDKAAKEVVNLFGAAHQERTIPWWVSGPPTLPFVQGKEDNPNGMALFATAVPEFEQARRAVNTEDMEGARGILEAWKAANEASAAAGVVARMYYNLGVVAHYSARFEEAREHYRKAYRLGNVADAQYELGRIDDDEARFVSN